MSNPILDIAQINKEFWKKINEEKMIAQQRNTEEQQRGMKDGKAKFTKHIY